MRQELKHLNLNIAAKTSLYSFSVRLNRLENNLELRTRHLFAVVEKPHSMLKYIHLILR